MLVFAYGTLKSGYGNHKYYLPGAVFLGVAVTVEPYAMLGQGIPYIVHTETKYKAPIRGELFSWNCTPKQLCRLDSLEMSYNRVQGKVRLEDGRLRLASYYVAKHNGLDKKSAFWKHAYDRFIDGEVLQWPARTT